MDYQKILLESVYVGILSFVVGQILFKLTVSEKDKNKNNNKLYMIFFVIGFSLHFFLEMVGLNKWYCDKRCALGYK
jgi:hypothetical protein